MATADDFKSGDNEYTILRKILESLDIIQGIISGGGTGTGSTLTTGTDKTVTVAGTAVKLSASSLPTPGGSIIMGRASNTQPVYIGDSTVTNAGGSKRGVVLFAGGMLRLNPGYDLTDVWVNSDVSGEGVTITLL